MEIEEHERRRRSIQLPDHIARSADPDPKTDLSLDPLDLRLPLDLLIKLAHRSRRRPTQRHAPIQLFLPSLPQRLFLRLTQGRDSRSGGRGRVRSGSGVGSEGVGGVTGGLTGVLLDTFFTGFTGRGDWIVVGLYESTNLKEMKRARRATKVDAENTRSAHYNDNVILPKPWNLALTITLFDLPNPSLLHILILPPFTPPRNPIAQILIPNHLVLLLMTDPLFFREPFPLGQRFRFR